jgi:hypothetical protein
MKKNQLLSLAVAGALALITSACEDNVANERPNGLGRKSYDKNQPAPAPAKSTVGDYTFTGKESDFIAPEIATAWMANYRQQNPGEREGHFFGNEIIQQLLAQKGAVGIRMYYALDDKGQKQLILVATDAKGKDLVPADAKLNPGLRVEGEPTGYADASWPCPGYC